MKASEGTQGKYPSTFHIGFFVESEETVNEINRRLKEDGYDVPAPEKNNHAYAFTSMHRVGSPSNSALEGRRIGSGSDGLILGRQFVADEITIPILPCRSIDETLEFYVAMGFEITYKQSRPNTYACVKRDNIELHFFTLKGYEPKDSYSKCFVLVPDLAGLHLAFSTGLRGHYGRLPIAGIPRISKLNNSNSDKQLRFNVINPGSNWVRFAQKGEQSTENDGAAPQKEGQTKLSRAVQAADWLVEAEGDFEKAAQMLDKALAHDEPVPLAHRVQALVLRVSLAVSLDDKPLARNLLNEIRQIPLYDGDRAALAVDLERAADLEQMLQ
jgi:hypothetical protein